VPAFITIPIDHKAIGRHWFWLFSLSQTAISPWTLSLIEKVQGLNADY
jgi:hypothetical protein